MAELILKDAFVRIGATGSTATLTNITDHVKSVTITHRRELQEITAMTDDARSRKAGLYDPEWALELNQDYASTKIDKTFWNMVGSSDIVIQVRPTTAVRGASNPDYRGHVLLGEYTPIAGAVGDVAVFSVTFTGNGTVTRVTSAS